MNMKKMIVLAVMVCAVLTGPVAWAQVEAVTKARYDLRLGFTVGGKVSRILVKPGDRVKKGQLLIELDDDEGKSLVELYQLRASSDLAAQSADAGLRLAKIEEKAIRRAFEKDAAMPIEVERAQLNSIQSKLELLMAYQQGQEAKHQLQQAQSRHDEYMLHAPITGIVDTVTVSEGELVESLKPILRLVMIDPLWVDANVPTRQTLGLNPGDTAWVRSQLLPKDSAPIRGKIIHLAEVADAASDTRLVRIEMSNAEHLPAGSQVIVTFDASTPSTSAETGTQRTGIR